MLPSVVLVTLFQLACAGSNSDSQANPETEANSSASSPNAEASASTTSMNMNMATSPAATGAPGPGAFDPNYETSSTFFTRLSEPVESNIHAHQRSWYSSNLADLPRQGPFTVPEGSVAIKAEYDDSGANFTTVVMIKREAGYDPGGNDWYYEVRNPDGSLSPSPAPGPIQLCSDCHSGSPNTDFLLGFDLEN